MGPGDVVERRARVTRRRAQRARAEAGVLPERQRALHRLTLAPGGLYAAGVAAEREIAWLLDVCDAEEG